LEPGRAAFGFDSGEELGIRWGPVYAQVVSMLLH
jgi:hypothetical protein